ncbi:MULTISPECIES: hypothetical protein [Planktothrix]|uniref:hypothetical protein n=1 Tax=Planktothrix TaxID=54304 RepID=UPI00040684A9|nr:MULTISPECIES: hypothetical protein [Planktothrix]
MENKDKDWIKNLRFLVKLIQEEEDRSWIEKRLDFEDKLLEEQRNDWFKLGKFLILDNELKNKEKEKEKLTPEDNQLLDSVGTILNEYLDMLKEIKGE